MGRHEEALPHLREAYALNSTDTEIRYHTGVTLLAPDRDEMRATALQELGHIDAGGGVSPAYLALTALLLGEEDRALDYLEFVSLILFRNRVETASGLPRRKPACGITRSLI